MSRQVKILLMIMMTLALACGFLHHLVNPAHYNFERLHIFLFNLCSGGTLLLCHSENRANLSPRSGLFLLLALAFALCAFLQLYIPAMLIPLALACLVERARWQRFGSIWPRGFFDPTETIQKKFHQAALLCLSLGLLLSSLAILNAEFLHLFPLKKLTLNTFFLGFSFPLSLISMAVIFGLMRPTHKRLTIALKEIAFWSINLGVIIFFLFILAERFAPQVGIATLLFISVGMILYLYWHEGIRLQQKAFLTSGIFFLLITSVTGILCILAGFTTDLPTEAYAFLLRLHAFTALYGWNLSGLIVIARQNDFPLQLHSGKVIVLHWLTVLLLCPLGYFLPIFAILALLCYTWLLAVLLFNQGRVDEEIARLQKDTQDMTGM